MKTVKVDSSKRVRLPDATPGLVFSYENEADGCIKLTPLKADTKEPFTKESLSRLWLEHPSKQLGAALAIIAKELPAVQ